MTLLTLPRRSGIAGGAGRLRGVLRRYVAAQERHHALLLAVQAVYLALFSSWLVFSHTWPAPDIVVAGLLLFAIVSARGLRFLRDWTPFLVLMLAYVALPGVTPGLVQRVHVGFPIAVDGWLGLGQLPTTRLQATLWDGQRLHWYDYLTAVLYLLHFIAPLALAFALWLWRRPLYVRFVAAYLLLMYAGFATYLIYPMAPPWWASQLGRIPTVQPVLGSVQWQGVSNPVVLLSRYFQTDPVAAMPSMHAAFPFLVWLVLWRLFPRWGWVAALYPLAMTFAVVYAGEHYLIDCLVGWLYAALAFLAVWGGPGAWRRLRRRGADRREPVAPGMDAGEAGAIRRAA